MAQAALRLLFPPRCAVCDGIIGQGEWSTAHGVHAGCAGRLRPVEDPVCMHCGRPLGEDGAEYCYDCEKRMLYVESPGWRGEPFSYIVQGKAVFWYEGAAKRMMYRFKYGNRREYADFLAFCACRQWGEWMVRRGVQAVAAVPMYRPKERRRGYNQAALFARAVAGLMGFVYLPDAVRRVRDTRPQKELNDAEREINLKNAFQAGNFIVQYNCILLVDDIYTTGSTAEKVAQELRRAGIREVCFLAACIGRGF